MWVRFGKEFVPTAAVDRVPTPFGERDRRADRGLHDRKRDEGFDMGKLWNIIEDYRDGLAFPPSYRQIAIRMGVSQSTFETWKNPTEIPKRRSLLAISRLTGVPYRRVVDA